MFVETISGNYVNADHVVRMIGKADFCFKLMDSNGEWLGDINFHEFQKLNLNVVPAQPGWSILHWYADGEPGAEYWREDILAWGIDEDSVVAFGIESTNRQEQTILSPSGKVTTFDCGNYDSIEEWKAKEHPPKYPTWSKAESAEAASPQEE